METKFKFLRNKGGKNLTKIKENTRKLKRKKINLFLSSKSYDKNAPVYWTIESQS
jgi:hypothetical protein